jgi:hypothetical protein
LAATTHNRVVEDAKTWRNGYAMLAGGLGALLGLIGNLLDHDTSACWRIILSICFGGALLATSLALVMVVTVEGGLRTTQLNLRATVTRFGSLEAYQVSQAQTAYARLDKSKWLAAAGALLGFLGLIATLWLPGKASDSTHPSTPASSTASTPPHPPSPPPVSQTPG